MQQTRLISIDLGNGYVKVVFGGKVFIFRAAFREGFREDNSAEGFDVRFQGKDYVVGAGNTSTTVIGDKITDISTLLYIVNALNIAFDSTNHIDNVELVLGLPASYTATYRDKLKAFILDNLKEQYVIFGDKKKSISINSVTVCMQGAVFATDITAFANKKTLVIDVGAGTMECLLFDNFKLKGEPYTIEKGMQKYWENLMLAINKSDNPILSGLSKYTDYKDVENCVINKEFIVKRVAYSIDDASAPFKSLIDKTLAAYYDQQLNTIRTMFNTDSLDNVVLTGGAANFLKPYFESKLGPCSLIELPNKVVDIDGVELSPSQIQQFTNAINYYKLVLIQASKK